MIEPENNTPNIKYQLFLQWYRNYLIRIIDVFTDPETPDYMRMLLQKGFGLGALEDALNTPEGLLAINNGDLKRIENEIAKEYNDA